MAYLDTLAALSTADRRNALRAALLAVKPRYRGASVKSLTETAVNFSLNYSSDAARDGEKVESAAHFVVDTLSYGIRWYEMTGRGSRALFEAKADRAAIDRLVRIADRFVMDRTADDYGSCGAAARAYKELAA